LQHFPHEIHFQPQKRFLLRRSLHAPFIWESVAHKKTTKHKARIHSAAVVIFTQVFLHDKQWRRKGEKWLLFIVCCMKINLRKIHHASCWSSSSSSPTIYSQRQTDVRPTCYIALARTQPTIHKGKTSIRRIVTISLSFRASKWNFFPAAPAKSSAHTCTYTSADSSQSVCITSSERVRERAIELLFIFVHFARARQAELSTARGNNFVI